MDDGSDDSIDHEVSVPAPRPAQRTRRRKNYRGGVLRRSARIAALAIPTAAAVNLGDEIAVRRTSRRGAIKPLGFYKV